MIELTSILGHVVTGIEQRAKGLLHGGDATADADLASKLFFQVRRRREVVGVDMGFKNPLNLGVQLGHPGDQRVGRRRRGMAGLGIVIQYAVHERAVTRSEEHTSELQSLMRISYAVFCLKTKNH